MIDKSKITSIDTAKNYNNYDGGSLDAAQKDVFDQTAVPKNADGTPKIVELQEIAETLEKVIQAKKATAWNKTLYDDLNARKTSNTYDYQAINYNNQYDVALTHLKSKDTQSPAPTPGTSEATIQAEIDALTTSIANFDSEIAKVRAQKKIVVELQATQITLEFNKEQEYKKIEDLKERLQNQGASAADVSTTLLPVNGKAGVKPILNIDDSENVNVYLRNFIEKGKSIERTTNLPKMWETNIFKGVPSYSSVTSHGRHFLGKTDAELMNFQIMECLRKIDDTKMKSLIGSNNKVKKIWEDLKASDWLTVIYDKSDSDVDMAGNVQIATVYKKDAEENVVRTNEEENIVLRGEEWINQTNFFELMRTVFPRGATGKTNAKNLEYDEKTTIRLRTFSKDPYVEKGLTSKPQKGFFEWFRSEFPNRRDELTGVWYENLNLQQVVDFFWDAYPPGVMFSDTANDTDFSKWNRTITGKGAVDYGEFCENLWIDSIRKAGYSHDIISSVDLHGIFLENYQYNNHYYIQTILDESGKKYIEESYKKDEVKLQYPSQPLVKSKVTGNIPNTITINSDFSGYLWIDGFDLALAKKRQEVSLAKAGANGYNGDIIKYGSDEANLLAQQAVLKEEKKQKEQKLAEIKTKSLEENIAAWKTLYGAGPGAKKYSKLEVWEIDIQYNKIKEQSETRKIAIDADVQTKWKKFEKDIKLGLAYAESEVKQLGAVVKTDGEKTKGLTIEKLTSLRDHFLKIERFRNLDGSEKSVLEVIKQRIAGTYKDDDSPSPTSDLTEATLGAIFNFVVETALLDKWKESVDGKILKEADIKRIVGAYSKDTDSAKFTALTSHLSEKGVVDGDKITGATPEEIWEKFLKNNEPSAVIKTIVTHENEDVLKDSPDAAKRNIIIERMKGTGTHYDTDPKKNKFDKEKYGNPEEPDTIDKDKLFAFLYAEKLENISQRSKTWEETVSDDNNGGSGDGNKSQGWKDWFVFREGNMWKPTLTYLGIFLTIVGVAAVIFWKNISDWWNGPADEQGEGETGEEKEEENE